MFRNFKVVSHVVFGRGCFNQLDSILSTKRENRDSYVVFLVDDVFKAHGRLGVGERLRYRVKNMSEGIAIGSHAFISQIQTRYNRKFIRPRAFLNKNVLFSTRVLGARP